MPASDPQFAKLAVELGNLYRPPPMTGTPPTRGAPTLIASAVAFTSFDPVSPDVVAVRGWERPNEVKQTFCEVEVREGDSITRAKDGLSYAVISVGEWDWAPGVTVYEVNCRQPKS
jgi:hypothetical protein